jgi:hypothetical protein
MFYLHNLGLLAGVFFIPGHIAAVCVFWLVTGLFPRSYPYLITGFLLIGSL